MHQLLRVRAGELLGRHAAVAVNPALGNETLLPFPRTTTPKHVVVVGAGPGGMETARVATERGHRVTLLDKTDRLGGTLWFSTLTTPDNERLLKWLTQEVRRAGVDVRLKTEATAATIKARARRRRRRHGCRARTSERSGRRPAPRAHR